MIPEPESRIPNPGAARNPKTETRTPKPKAHFRSPKPEGRRPKPGTVPPIRTSNLNPESRNPEPHDVWHRSASTAGALVS
ncbi:hypothetical protein T484DRAFT_1943106 [Baffinella frigidus]|nr:hypothetical protein T484DRAFT_1943106 [Cryptophyta sp. CCMP2293]